MLQAIQEYTTARWFWTDWIGLSLVMAAGHVLNPRPINLPAWARWVLGMLLVVGGQFAWRFYG